MTMQIELYKLTSYAKEITIYDDGERRAYSVGEPQFEQICAVWDGTLAGAHQMPAFGVSLNGETVRAMKQGLWLEFDFGTTCISDGMDYEKLLVNVEREFNGFNIIRYNSSCGYDGRCFYFDLVRKDMSALYDVIKKLN